MIYHSVQQLMNEFMNHLKTIDSFIKSGAGVRNRVLMRRGSYAIFSFLALHRKNLSQSMKFWTFFMTPQFNPSAPKSFQMCSTWSPKPARSCPQVIPNLRFLKDAKPHSDRPAPSGKHLRFSTGATKSLPKSMKFRSVLKVIPKPPTVCPKLRKAHQMRPIYTQMATKTY